MADDPVRAAGPYRPVAVRKYADRTGPDAMLPAGWPAGSQRHVWGKAQAMSKPFRGVINIDIKQSTPDWDPYTQPKAPDGAPSVLYIVLDDVGFGAMEPFGGPIRN